MKKRFVFLLVAAALLLSCPFSMVAFAEENEAEMKEHDSRNVDEATRQFLGVTDPDETVIIRYNVGLLYFFDTEDNVEKVLADPAMRAITYVVRHPDGTYSLMTIYDGVPYNASVEWAEYGWRVDEKMVNIFFDEHYLQTFLPDVRVNDMYYLDGSSSRTGTAIYYGTDQGDYIFFQDRMYREYLFTAEDFIALHRAVFDEIKKKDNTIIEMGEADINTFFDLTSHEIHSDIFDVNAPIPGLSSVGDRGVPAELLVVLGVVLAAAAAAGGVWAVKRKKRTA